MNYAGWKLIILICKGSEDKTWGNLYKNEAVICILLYLLVYMEMVAVHHHQKHMLCFEVD